ARSANRRGAGHALPTMSGVGAEDREAHEAAVAAVQTVLPLPWQEASIEAVSAVAYATRYHPEWFWRGAQHTEKWRATVRDNLDRRDPRHDPHCRTTFHSCSRRLSRN